MSPDAPPGAADDTNVDAGAGRRGDAEATGDSFVWTTEPDSSVDVASGDGDDVPHDLHTERVAVRHGDEYNGEDDGRSNGDNSGDENDGHRGRDADDPRDEDGDAGQITRPGAPAEGVGVLDPERYLLAGETLVERVETDRGWVVVTTHRLLVYDPTADGKRFERVDRPNVLDVDATAGGSPKLLSYIARAAVYAVVLLGGGLVGRSLGLRGLFSTTVATESTPAVSGLVSMLSFVGALVGLIVDALVWGGVVLGIVALGLAVWYLRSRHPTLVLERAGADDLTVRLPPNTDVDSVVATIERALAAELAAASA